MGELDGKLKTSRKSRYSPDLARSSNPTGAVAVLDFDFDFGSD